MKKKAKAVKRKKKTIRRGTLPRAQAKPRPKAKPRKKNDEGFKLNFVRIGEGNWEKKPHVWQIQDVLAWEDTCMLSAVQKTGKSWFLMEMAVCTASGIPFLGRYAVHKTGPVLIYSPELEQSILESRIAEICGRRGLDPTALNIHIDSQYGLRLELDDNQKMIADNIAQIRPAMVMFDPLKHCCGCSLRSEPKVKKMTDFFVHLKRQYKCAVVVAHHSTKSSRNHEFGGQGSSTLGTFGASNLSMISTGEHRSELATQQRHGSPITINLRLDGAEGKESRCVMIEDANAVKEERKLCLNEKMEKAMLEFLGQYGPASFNAIDDEVPGRRITKLRLLHGLKKTKAVSERTGDKWEIFKASEVVPECAHTSSVADTNAGITTMGAENGRSEAIAENEMEETPLDNELMGRIERIVESEIEASPARVADLMEIEVENKGDVCTNGNHFGRHY